MPLDRIKTGVDFALEAQANEILRQGRIGVTRLCDKQDYLSEEQLQLRYSREVFNHMGVPDGHLMSGLYNRAYNPHAGDRPTGLRNSEDG